MLVDAIIGTPGKSITYRLSDVPDKIRFIPKPTFIVLEKKSTLVATCCLCHRKTRVGPKEINVSYIRYFAFLPAYQKSPKFSKNNKTGTTGSLKKEILSLLEFPAGRVSHAGEQHLFYAYVDQENHRSVSLCDLFGFRQIRSFSTLVFSRYSPKANPSVGRILPHEKEEVITRLKEFYRQYNLFSTDNLFFRDNYYVLKNVNGEILAGVQANNVRWKIDGFPGLIGKYLLGFISNLPIIRRFINMDFSFTSFEAVFYKKGCEKYLEKLFESVLAMQKTNTALIWADDRSYLLRQVKKIDRGVFGSMLKFKSANVIIKSQGLSDQEETTLNKLPAYISAFDLT